MSLPETLWFIARNFPIYPTLGILTYVLFNGIYKSIKGAYSGPLSAFPGPDFAAMTVWYKTYIELYQKRSWTTHLRELHKIYGEAPLPIAAGDIALTLSQDLLFVLDQTRHEYSTAPGTGEALTIAAPFRSTGSILRYL